VKCDRFGQGEAASIERLLPQGPPGPPVDNYLNDLRDVTVSKPADCDIIKYNGTEWVNEPLSLVGNLNDLGDVKVSKLADCNIL
jgi:hypothetical protein